MDVNLGDRIGHIKIKIKRNKARLSAYVASELEAAKFRRLIAWYHSL